MVQAGTAAAQDDRLIERLRRWSEPLPLPEDQSFADAFDVFGPARVVSLGEASHGTSEFYRARTAITRRLIERHGFTIVAVEADWPDAAQLDAYVRQRKAPPLPEALFSRFPTWMWRNEEVREFIAWLRAHNDALPYAHRVEFRGLDIYSLGASIAAVLHTLNEIDPAAAKTARERYACLSPWQGDPVRYGRAVLSGRDPCEDKVVEQLQHLLAVRLDAHEGAGFDAVQNARVVRAAEHYYRAMYLGGNESWNLRDRHMFETLKALLDVRPGARPSCGRTTRISATRQRPVWVGAASSISASYAVRRSARRRR
jgi:erythromycin esterase-like protein